ncbi:MAG: hypothetical protein PVG49_18015 [Desulfobacteraceae bacterium]|jgi:hypothetical protein
MTEEKKQIRDRRIEAPVSRIGAGVYTCITFFVGALGESWLGMTVSMN